MSAKDTPNFKVSEFLCPCCGKGADIISQDLLDALQELRGIVRKPMVVSSGYRCHGHNKKIGGAKKSAHLEGKAADILDDGAIATILSARLCEKLGIWIEDPQHTKGWVHIQVRPASLRIFRPY